MTNRLLKACLLSAFALVPAFAQNGPNVRLLVPERTRLLKGQYMDLVIEVRNATKVSNVSVIAGGIDISAKFSAPVAVPLDCNTVPSVVVRANLQSFETPGDITLNVSANADGQTVTDSRKISVQDFNLANRRNIILFIGDAMGTAYRDAARLVSRSIVNSEGHNSFREGFFDNLLEMDKMPVSGMSMTYGTDSVVPDSANTGSAWATGNKSYLNAVNVIADGTDCYWRFTGLTNAANLKYIVDNPRIENLWQYLKRRHGYRTGIVSTAAITDATPAVEGSYVGYRQARLEIARQYRENPMLGGKPAFDVILGGGTDPFTAAGRTDGRDLIGEFKALGFRYVTNATDLSEVTGGQPLLGLFKGSAKPAPASNGIATASDVNMDVAYDKLGYHRPASEPVADLGGFTDQPMLPLMTRKALQVLHGDGSTPFILMVEGASIDKQSHPNQAAGQIWDTIEFDKAVGIGRAWSKVPGHDSLVVVTADHDQSMSIIGVSNTPDTEYFNTTNGIKMSFTSAAGDQNSTVYGDSYSNVRAGLPFINSSTGSSNNGGALGQPGTFAPVAPAATPETSTYSTYFGIPAYTKDIKTGYPLNEGPRTRRLAVGYRTGDHTGSSVPVTAEGPGALLFTGYMDESDLFFKMAATLSNDTTALDKMVELLSGKSSVFPKTYGK